jgi:hypothetical protein
MPTTAESSVAARLTPVESRGVANPFHNGGALLGGPTQGLTSVSTVGCRWDIPRMNDSHRYLDANADLAGVRVPAQLALYRSAYPSLKASSVNYQLADPPITGVWRRPASAEGRAHERPDLTIGGIVMPTTDGYEIARELRDACCRRWKSYARVLASRQSTRMSSTSCPSPASIAPRLLLGIATAREPPTSFPPS